MTLTGFKCPKVLSSYFGSLSEQPVHLREGNGLSHQNGLSIFVACYGGRGDLLEQFSQNNSDVVLTGGSLF